MNKVVIVVVVAGQITIIVPFKALMNESTAMAGNTIVTGQVVTAIVDRIIIREMSGKHRK